MARKLVLLILGALLLLGLAFIATQGRTTFTPAAPAQLVTIDNSDGVGGTIDPINVWDDYTARTAVVAKAHGGDRVQLLRQSGNGVYVRTTSGVQGWVSAQFIKELK